MKTRCSRLRGLTVVEILIGLTLFSILSILITFAFTRAAQLTSRENAILEIEQSAHFIVRDLEEKLLSSGISGISYFTRDDSPYEGCAISKISDISNEGNLVWENDKTVYYWESSENSLYKARLARSGLSKLPPPLASADLSGLSSSSMKMGDDISEFSVTNERSDDSGRLVRIILQKESSSEGSTTHRKYQIDKTIDLKY